MSSDKFKTLKGEARGMFRDRGSKFIAVAMRVNTLDEVKEGLERVKSEFRDARHHCYAYTIGHNDDNWRVNDDGEPSGTAGKPIMGQINSMGLSNVLIVVVRYFGGTLLGVGGLINAYRSASRDALENAKIITATIRVEYLLEFPYASMNDVMTIIKEENLEQFEQVFELACSLRVRMPLSSEERVVSRFNLVNDLIITLCCD